MQDAVIISGVRTAVGAFGGALKKFAAHQLGTKVLNGLMERTQFDRTKVDEVIFGHGYVHGGGLNAARIASQKAHFPKDIPAYIVIKACGSSLKALTNGVASIQSRQEDVIIIGGIESMSNVPYIVKNRWGTKFGNVEMEDALLEDGLICSLQREHMGVTAERLANQYNISREAQDDFAYKSHKKAFKAIQTGKFADEIIPIELNKRGNSYIFSHDESVRPSIDRQKISELPSAFQKGGDVTAGNACPMNDGAAALLMMSEQRAKEENLKPKLKVKAYASAGVDPAVMGIGPVLAIQKALKKAQLSIDNIDLIELNEAFAAQALAVIKELNLDESKVNVNGGAIALGHPVGATGAKLTVSLMYEMFRREAKHGIVAMCMAGGMGIAVIFENLQVS